MFCTKARIWQQIRAYLGAAWTKLADRIRAGSITEDKAAELFGFNFGTHAKVCSIDEISLSVVRIPPEPD